MSNIQQPFCPVKEMKLPRTDCSGSDLPESSENDVVCGEKKTSPVSNFFQQVDVASGPIHK